MGYDAVSLQTRRAFADALRELLPSTPLDRITVTRLSAITGLSRKTFYYHFTDLQDLVAWILEEESIRIGQRLDPHSKPEQVLSIAIDYLDTNRQLLAAIYLTLGREKLRHLFYNDLADVIGRLIDEAEHDLDSTLDGSYRELVVSFYTEALATQMLERILHPKRLPRDRVIRYLIRTIGAGIRGSLEEPVASGT